MRVQKHYVCEKDHIWNPSTSSCKNGIYLESIIDKSVTTCVEIVDAEETKIIPKNII